MLRKVLIMIVTVVAMAPVLHAQARKSQGMRMNNVHPGTFIDKSGPTRVSGEGTTTPSGVRYWDLQTGRGDPATKGHAVTVVYRAWLEKDGKEFASSVSDGRPLIFTLGIGQVIHGWEEGMEGMRVGGTRQLRIPPELAYGASGIPDLVPPNSTLIFDVELISLR